MQWLAIVFFCLMITPLRFGAKVRLDASLHRAAWGVLIWGVRFHGEIALRRDEAGVLRLAASPPLPTPIRRQTHPKRRFAFALRRSRPARYVLLRGSHIALLDVSVQIGGDAARAALLTGLVRAVGSRLPQARLRCVPRFGGASALDARCIVDVRLGTIGAAALTGWLNRPRAGRKEEA